MALAKDNRGNTWEASYSVNWEKTNRQMREGQPKEATHVVQIFYSKETGEPTDKPYGVCDVEEYTFYVCADSVAEVQEAYPVSTITALGKPAVSVA